MRIFQVTDPHVPVRGDMAVRDNFIQLMQHTADEKPDLLVLTGDLPGEDGSRAAYEDIRANLPDVPTLVLPGNHDDPAELYDVFRNDLNNNPEFMHHMPLDEIDLLFMNTATNYLPEAQLDVLKGGEFRQGSVLFVHHPTCEVSGGWMDQTYPLMNRDAVHAVLCDSPVSHVFCGHYHADTVVESGYQLHVTPSPAFNVDLYADDVKIGQPDVPFREIVIEGASVSTRVVRL